MNTDWLFWIGGGLVGLCGLALCAWALFADRSRGRKRCPKCWYDMSQTSGSGLRCPECGHEAKHERKLFGTRRRWKWAFVSFVPFLVAVALLVQPKVQRDGWPSIVPNTSLIVALYLPDHGWALEELDRRVGSSGGGFPSDNLWRWQWKLLGRPLDGILANKLESLPHKRSALLLTAFLASRAADERCADRAYLTIANALADPDPRVREFAVLLIAECPDEDRTIKLIISMLDDSNASVRTNAAGALMIAARHNSRAWPALKEVLDHSSPEARGAAAYFAATIAAEHDETEEIFERLLALYETDSDDLVKVRVLKGFARLRVDVSRIQGLLLAAMEDPSPQVRAQAIDDVSFLDATPELVDGVIKALDDPDVAVSRAAAETLAYINPPSLLVSHFEWLESKARTFDDAGIRQTIHDAIRRAKE